MIEVMSIRELKTQDYDACWAIVRSLKSQTPGLVQVADLSPSRDLFFEYRRMANAGTWGRQAFDEIYLPRFLREVKHNPSATALLAHLYEQDRLGKRIALVCFCSDESLCHRSIIAGILQGAGCDVRAKADYSKYWPMYQAA